MGVAGHPPPTPTRSPRLAGTLGSALSSASSGFHPRFINKLSSPTWRKKKPGDPVCSSSPRPTPGVLPEVPRPPRHRAGAALRSSPGWASGTVGHFPNSRRLRSAFPPPLLTAASALPPGPPWPLTFLSSRRWPGAQSSFLVPQGDPEPLRDCLAWVPINLSRIRHSRRGPPGSPPVPIPTAR